MRAKQIATMLSTDTAQWIKRLNITSSGRMGDCFWLSRPDKVPLVIRDGWILSSKLQGIVIQVSRACELATIGCMSWSEYQAAYVKPGEGLEAMKEWTTYRNFAHDFECFFSDVEVDETTASYAPPTLVRPEKSERTISDHVVRIAKPRGGHTPMPPSQETLLDAVRELINVLQNVEPDYRDDVTAAALRLVSTGAV